MIEISISSLPNMAATSHILLSSTWNVATMTKELDLKFILL